MAFQYRPRKRKTQKLYSAVYPRTLKKVRQDGRIVSNIMLNYRGEYAQIPFSERARQMCEHIDSLPNGRMTVNRKYCHKTNTNEPMSKDLRRMLKAGMIRMGREKHYKTNGYSYVEVVK